MRLQESWLPVRWPHQGLYNPECRSPPAAPSFRRTGHLLPASFPRARARSSPCWLAAKVCRPQRCLAAAHQQRRHYGPEIPSPAPPASSRRIPSDSHRSTTHNASLHPPSIRSLFKSAICCSTLATNGNSQYRQFPEKSSQRCHASLPLRITHLGLLLSKITAQHQHIAHENAMFNNRRLNIAEIVFAHMVHTKTAFLVEGNVLKRGTGRSHQHSAHVALPRLFEQARHDRFAIAATTHLWHNGNVNNLALILLPGHRYRADDALTLAHNIGRMRLIAHHCAYALLTFVGIPEQLNRHCSLCWRDLL